MAKLVTFRENIYEFLHIHKHLFILVQVARKQEFKTIGSGNNCDKII